MKELINIFDNNNIHYFLGDYAGYKSIVIKNNKYKLEIFKNENGFVSDLQKIPYTWGRMGSTTLEDIFNDLFEYLKIDIKHIQLNLFEI